MDEPGQGRYLTRHDLETVIRRATELEAAAGSAVPELTETDVVRIAHEVGLSEASVRRALAEHGGVGGLLAERGWISGVCGPGLLTASRVVQRPAEEVKLEMESHFESNESLRVVRRTDSESLWEPDRGVVAAMQRGLSELFGRGYQLAKRGRVGLQVVPLSEESCQVSMTVDFCNTRSGWFWGLGVAVGAPLTLFVVGLVLGSPIPDAWVALAPAPFFGTISLARAGYRRARAKLRLLLDGLLDRVEHDDPLEPRRTSWRDLLQ